MWLLTMFHVQRLYNAKLNSKVNISIEYVRICWATIMTSLWQVYYRDIRSCSYRSGALTLNLRLSYRIVTKQLASDMPILQYCTPSFTSSSVSTDFLVATLWKVPLILSKFWRMWKLPLILFTLEFVGARHGRWK